LAARVVPSLRVKVLFVGGCQPRIVPSSVEKTKNARALNDQNTAPVGPPGTLTTSDCGVPSAVYSVDLSVPLSATHHGVPGPEVRPQPLTRFGSGFAATPKSDVSR